MLYNVNNKQLLYSVTLCLCQMVGNDQAQCGWNLIKRDLSGKMPTRAWPKMRKAVMRMSMLVRLYPKPDSQAAIQP